MWLCVIFPLFLSLIIVIDKSDGTSSPIQPFTAYKHSTELQANVADLWWTVDNGEKEIMFELHIKTTGWIALGISPAGGMRGADIGVGWVDRSGKVHFQDRHAFNNSRPVIDTTTTDWFALQGREQNGWTAIQFKRLLDTCDKMDVPIKSGSNVLIFAYGLTDPDGDISYHDTRRGSRIIPLRSYANPPLDKKFTGLDFFEFSSQNYQVPSNDTTYHCKVYKAPTSFLTKRHAIAHKALIEPANVDLVHHLLMFECDPAVTFDDADLPDGLCDNIYTELEKCTSNLATVWSVGGDHVVEYVQEAGYPVGKDFPIQYYVIQTHYDNPELSSNRIDSSGFRFYLGNELRQHDLGYLSFGALSNSLGLAIPPRVDRFIVNTYCSAKATQNIPESGITILASFPHTHLQGQTVWTKLIRNNTAIQYLFNGESYDFNYQFDHRLPKSIKIYRGDAFATQCSYNTMNKNEITLGGERTKDEMCLHMFTYYPRMNDFYSCFTMNNVSAWETMMNIPSLTFDYNEFTQWLKHITWTSELAIKWQEFYNSASRFVLFGRSGHLDFETFATLPKYEDLKSEQCKKTINDG